MSEPVWLAVFAAVSSALGGVVLLLLSIIIHELRALRQELKNCVPDPMCHILMSAHARRIETLEREIS